MISLFLEGIYSIFHSLNRILQRPITQALTLKLLCTNISWVQTLTLKFSPSLLSCTGDVDPI